MQGLARLQANGCGGRHHRLCLPQQQRRLADLQRAPLTAVPQKKQQRPRRPASSQSLASSRPLTLPRNAAGVIARSSSPSAAAAASSSSSSSFNENNDDGGGGLPHVVAQAAKVLAVAGAAATFAAWRAGYGPVILVSLE